MSPKLDKCPVESDPEMLLVEDVAPIIRARLDEINRENASVNEYGQIVKTGALERFALATGMEPRTINRVLAGESPIITLDLADRIFVGLDLNISMVLPEDAFYRKSQLVEAKKIETELLILIARCRGEYVPPVGKRKEWPEKFRRKIRREEAQAA